MSGRNTHPDRDGERSNPSRLDQFGETLANDNDLSDLKSAQETRAGDESENACD